MTTSKSVLAAIASVVALAVTSAPEVSTASAVPNSIQQVYYGGTRTSPSIPITDYAGDLLTLQAVDVGTTAAEPTIGVGPDGTAYFSGSVLDIETNVTWGVAQTKTMRSTDGGLSWQLVQLRVPVADLSILPGNLDPLIYVDPSTGRVFNIDLYGVCSWLNFSDDHGETWIPSPLSCGVLVNDHQTMVAGVPRGGHTTSLYPNALYYCVNQLIQTGCGRSFDGGFVWTPMPEMPYPILNNEGGCGGLTGHLETDPEGRLFIPAGSCDDPHVAISEDSGDTWTRVQVATSPVSVSHTSVAADEAGNLYYAWISLVGTRRLPFLAISTDHGLTWGTPIMIAPPGVNHANFPVVAAGDAGHIAINFPGTTATSQTRTAPWNQYVAVSANALDAAPIFLSATGNDPADPIHRGGCLGRCGGMWDFIDVQVSGQGDAWAAASDDCLDVCVTGTGQMAHTGRGIAIRQIGGPSLRS